MPADLFLRSAREGARLNQTDLAIRAKTAQPNVSSIERGNRSPTVDTLERLLTAARHSLIVIPGIGPDAARTGARIAGALARGRENAALRAFIDYSDALALVSGVPRIALTIAAPARTGDPRWDAALAALVDYWLNDEKLPKPEWISASDRYLSSLQDLVEGPHAPPIDVATVPTEFLSRNILVERGTLASV